jgi:hypothetical protein
LNVCMAKVTINVLAQPLMEYAMGGAMRQAAA